MVTSLVSSEFNRTHPKEKYSLSRLIKNKINSREQHGLETEISKNLELEFGNKQNFHYLIPPEAIGYRGLSTNNTGSNLIATEQSDFFYHAPPPQSKVVQLGAQLLTGLSDNYEINGSVDPFQAYWVDSRKYNSRESA